MTEDSPTLVAVYEFVATGYERVAEFRLTPQERVALTLREPQVCPLAQRWYSDGVQILGEARYVTRDDGPAFMRALLQPFRMSYCRVIDESAAAATASTAPSARPPRPTPWSSTL